MYLKTFGGRLMEVLSQHLGKIQPQKSITGLPDNVTILPI